MLRFMTRRLPVAVAGVTLLALVACGGSGAAPDGGAAQGGGESDAANAPDTGGGGGGDVDLCAVLTLDEVSAAAGVEATDAQGASGAGYSSCNYNAADGSPIAGNTLTTGAAGVSGSQMFDSNLGVEGAEEISGVGDRAVLIGDENFPILVVLKGDRLYQISVLADNLDGDGKRQATIDLGRISVDRLP